jgi:hypothetical protein
LFYYYDNSLRTLTDQIVQTFTSKKCRRPMNRIVCVPSITSLSQLLSEGYISSDDVHPVTESTHILAEQQYAARRPSTVLARTRQSYQRTSPPVVERDPARITHYNMGSAARELASMEEKERSPKEWTFDICCICFSRDRDHAAIPCFHLCVCNVCSQRLVKCPLCRKPSTSFHKIYLS